MRAGWMGGWVAGWAGGSMFFKVLVLRVSYRETKRSTTILWGRIPILANKGLCFVEGALV